MERISRAFGTAVRPFFVYMLECADGSFYVGHTDDLEKRLAEHEIGLDAYTSQRLPVALVYSCPIPTRDEALARERQVKGWTRAKKQALLMGDWERVQRLSRNGAK
jgi:predicted GIY-YIG superfamily endonuclease